MIRSIYIDNFKALNDFTIQLKPFTVLIGDNSAGKTTILQAIAFLKYCCISDSNAFLTERGIPPEELISKLGSKKTISFTVELELRGKKINWEFSMVRAKDQFELRHERVVSGNKTLLAYKNNGVSYRMNAETGEKDPIMAGSYSGSIIRFTDVVKQEKIYPELVALKTFFAGIETMDLLSPSNMKRNSKGNTLSIGTGGEKLGAFIKYLSLAERKELVEDVKKFFGAFRSVVPKTKQYGWIHLETREAYADKSVDVSAVNVSDGIMRIIALCALRQIKSDCSTILLDEIEDGVNNEHFETLVSLLRTITEEKHIQLIATSHNTSLLDYWIDATDGEKKETVGDNAKESIVFLSRSDIGKVDAQDLLNSAVVRERLNYMYPGEIVQSMTNQELRDSLIKE